VASSDTLFKNEWIINN
jgi:hypothetical protein